MEVPSILTPRSMSMCTCDSIMVSFKIDKGFTPSELIDQNMVGWEVSEDTSRHSKWHGKNATWFDVLTNKISVDRSSVGNALYLVLNLASSGQSGGGKFARIDEWATSNPTAKSTINNSLNQQQFNTGSNQNLTQNSMTVNQGLGPRNFNQIPVNQGQGLPFDAQAMYMMQLRAQEQMQAQMMQGAIQNSFNQGNFNQQNAMMGGHQYQNMHQYQNPSVINGAQFPNSSMGQNQNFQMVGNQNQYPQMMGNNQMMGNQYQNPQILENNQMLGNSQMASNNQNQYSEGMHQVGMNNVLTINP